MEETCLFGLCSVAKGTIAISIIDIIFSLLSILNYSFNLNTMIHSPETLPDHVFPGFQDSQALYITVYIGGLLMAIVYCAVSGLLFTGARAGNHGQCMPWLYWNYISIGCMTTYTILISIAIAAVGHFAAAFWNLIFGAVFIAFAVVTVNVVKRFVAGIKDI